MMRRHAALMLFPALLLAGAASAADSGSTASARWSASSSRTINPSDPRDIARRAPVMPVADATAIALKRVPGTVLGAVIETNDGIRTWQIDIAAHDGRRVRMWLNAGNGDFLKIVNR